MIQELPVAPHGRPGQPPAYRLSPGAQAVCAVAAFLFSYAALILVLAFVADVVGG